MPGRLDTPFSPLTGQARLPEGRKGEDYGRKEAGKRPPGRKQWGGMEAKEKCPQVGLEAPGVGHQAEGHQSRTFLSNTRLQITMPATVENSLPRKLFAPKCGALF